ncbi:hypothetical protein OAN96_00280 [Candidatus Gracilibacteria bacterium]|nr:hypothetical protein [Candidatus Gracilibacteria bacterium]
MVNQLSQHTSALKKESSLGDKIRNNGIAASIAIALISNTAMAEDSRFSGTVGFKVGDDVRGHGVSVCDNASLIQAGGRYKVSDNLTLKAWHSTENLGNNPDCRNETDLGIAGKYGDFYGSIDNFNIEGLPTFNSAMLGYQVNDAVKVQGQIRSISGISDGYDIKAIHSLPKGFQISLNAGVLPGNSREEYIAGAIRYSYKINDILSLNAQYSHGSAEAQKNKGFVGLGGSF